MQEIKMRRITLKDVPALSFIAKKTFYDTFTGTCTEDDMNDFLEKYYNESTLAKEVADSAMEYFFAEMEGEIVGYILFSNGTEDFAEIHGSTALELKRFYISKEYHGKGAAQQMMNFFLDHAKAQGYDTVFLGCGNLIIGPKTFTANLILNLLVTSMISQLAILRRRMFICGRVWFEFYRKGAKAQT